MTYKELIYMVLDELKMSSNDAYYTPDHIIFLLTKYRSFLLKQRYSDIKKQIPISNYQDLCLELEKTTPIPGLPCVGNVTLRSKQPIPTTMTIGTSRVYPTDYFLGDIAFISRDRLKYVGYNKYLNNILYCSIAPDGHLYFKSSNPQHLYLEQVKFSGIFEDAGDASKLSCNDTQTTCDIEDKQFPIEAALVPPMIELIVNELRGPVYSPEDSDNNAKDDLAEVGTK